MTFLKTRPYHHKTKPPKETMSCWHILNIAPTNDERAIKRAYAKLLKTTRPDDDAAAYQRLRQAFDDALAAAPYIGADDDADDGWAFDNEFDDAAAHGAEQDERPSENNADDAGAFADGFSETSSPHGLGGDGLDDTANAFLARLHRIRRLAGGRGLLKTWPQLAERLAALPEAERALVAAHLAQWLEQPRGLPKKLQTLWRKACGPAGQGGRPSENGANRANAAGATLPQGADTPVVAVSAALADYAARGGSAELLHRLPQLRALLDAVPPEQIDDASDACAAFLRAARIDSPQLRLFFADYFNWFAPFYRHILGQDEARELEYWRHMAQNGFSDFSDGQSPPPSDNVRLLAAAIRKTYWDYGSTGLAAQWPQFAGQIGRFGYEDYDDITAVLAAWPYLHRLSAELVDIWYENYGVLSSAWYENGGETQRPSPPKSCGDDVSENRENTFSDGLSDGGAALGLQYQNLFQQLEAWYQAGGLATLVHRRAQTFALFDAFPDASLEQLEQETFRFLLRHYLADSPLAGHWREYFRRRAENVADTAPPPETQPAPECGSDDGFDNGFDIGSDNNFDEHTDLLPFIARCHAAGGSPALAQSWPQLRELLDSLPLGAAEELSPQFAAFLRRRHIAHPLIWTQWADYFRWGEDVYNHILTPAESQQLAHHRRIAALTAEAPQNAANGFSETSSPHDFGGDGLQEDGGTRYTRAFDRFLGSCPGFWRRFRAACAAMVVWPELSGETGEEERAALAAYRPALSRLLEWGGEWRGAWLIVILAACITLGVWQSPGEGSQTAAFQLPLAAAGAAAAALLASTLYAVGFGALLYIPLLGRFLGEKWMAVKYSAKAAPVYLFLLPVLFALLVQPAQRYGEGTPAEFLLFCAGIVGWTYYFPYLGAEYDGKNNINWALANLPLAGLALWIAKTTGDPWQIPALTSCILWLNAALYILFAHTGLYERAIAFIRRNSRFQTALGLPLLPFAALPAAALWLLLLPAHTARAAMQGQYGLIFEPAAAALVLLIPLPESLYPHSLLLLYPALLLAVWLRRLAAAAILHLLENSSRGEG